MKKCLLLAILLWNNNVISMDLWNNFHNNGTAWQYREDVMTMYSLTSDQCQELNNKLFELHKNYHANSYLDELAYLMVVKKSISQDKQAELLENINKSDDLFDKCFIKHCLSEEKYFPLSSENKNARKLIIQDIEKTTGIKYLGSFSDI